MFKNEVKINKLPKLQQIKYRNTSKMVKKIAQRAKIKKLRICFVKQTNINAASDAKLSPQLIVFTTGLIKNLDKICIMGAIAHEIGHLISLKNDVSMKHYHLDNNDVVQFEYIADEIGSKLVGTLPILKYLEQSKAMLLHTRRHKLFNTINRWKIIPAPICRYIVRSDKHVWRADDFEAPTLDPRISRLKIETR